MFSFEERMGPRWSERELLILFEGLRSHGKNWWAISQEFSQIKDPSVFCRTEQMIEAVFLKNKTYLSIPSANPKDFAAIMADHYDSYENFKFETIDDEGKKHSPPNENFEIPKKRSERPSELKTSMKRPGFKKLDFEISSRLADPNFFSNKKLIEGYSKRIFADFVYSPSIYLAEYASSKADEAISPKFLQWCKAEWFYSYIDKEFFLHNEFEEALKALKMTEIEEFTKYEFSVIRNVLGRPRRFSPVFVSQERKKLQKYREAMKVLQQGKVLPSTYHDMLPYIKMSSSNSSSRLTVGQRVLAVHPNTRELRSGSILTLDSYKYHIQFDRPELGVTAVTDIQILPISGDSPKAFDLEETPTFVYKPVQEREVVSPNFVIDGFKAGVNIYAMAFLLKLLERKEALIEQLKKHNSEFAAIISENPNWRPDNDLQQQYAWICVTVQAINTSISKVLEIFRLRNKPPPQPVIKVEEENKIEQIKDAAQTLIMELELDQRSALFSESELSKIQDSLKNGVVLLGVLDLIVKENDLGMIKHLEENLTLLSPACESNKTKYEEVCKYVEQIKNKISSR